jgi:hypothetical protein
MENPDFLNPKDILQNILEVLRCPFCGSDYLEKDTRIKAQFDKDYVIHLTCTECQNSILANFSYKNGLETSDQRQSLDGQKMDMAMGELIRFVGKGTINDDEVMNFYKEIRDFDGDFKKIFKTRNKNNK